MVKQSSERMPTRPYPTRLGVPISPFEIGLNSPFEVESDEKVNNHHGEFTRRYFGSNIILQTMRDLDINQWVLYESEHIGLHNKFGPPQLPNLRQSMNVINDEFDKGGLLKLGSVGEPEYVDITEDLMRKINHVYNELRA